MSMLVAILLGLIQGLSEFIPISSTAHLTIAAAWLDVIDPAHPERWTAFMATIQLGTLLAVVAYFRRDIISILAAFVRENLGPSRRSVSRQSTDARMGWFVILGTIPIVVVGLAFKDVIEGSLTKEMPVIATGLIGVGALLWWADRSATFTKTSSQMTVTDAILIGCAQVLALVPGSSRSGTTIMAGLFRGLTREHAARYSFLMSIPAIAGAGVLEFVGELDHLRWDRGGAELLAATIAAGISGYWSISFLLRYLRNHSVQSFVLYRMALGAVILLTACTPNGDSLADATTSQPANQQTQPQALEEALGITNEHLADVTDVVQVRTSMGAFTIGLYGKDAPKTVENFLGLVTKKYYDGILIHRVAHHFVIQMGDRRTRDRRARREWGRGGETATGEPLAEELDPETKSAKMGYVHGVVAMARKPAPGTGTSQFFVCLDSATTLPLQYTIFGRVIEGLDVVDKIGAVPVEAGVLGEGDGLPKRPIRVRSIRKQSSQQSQR